ncbi:NB-ARC domain-containing protein [Armatimonas sp.]|uniref:NB-ARC domain-containing protein n=1 Tax=Armatimonas sp. TaxID=1872638 RepID=UPI00286B4639|nr:NB-ARC domain-containing protein [Armatimonas sp.]
MTKGERFLYEITLTDGLAVRLGPTTRTTFPTRKAATLLAYLVTHPGNHSREKLLELFWPDLELYPARHALSMALSHLRNALERDFDQPKGSLLRASRDSIGLELAAYTTDLESLPIGFDTERLLPGFYDDWVLALRQSLAEALPLAFPRASLNLEPLPAALVPFLGRGALRESLPELLKRSRLLTLVGTGGVGKTRLALELLRDLEAKGSAVAWVELAALTESDKIADRIATTLGLQNTEALILALRQSPLVLGLDNCEHLVEGAAQVARQLLSACPPLTIVTTSREPLHVMGETLVPVPCLTQDEAIALFCEGATRVQPGWEPSLEQHPLLVRLCQALDCLPLALELAATKLRQQSLSELVQRLESSLEVLAPGNRGAAPRQQTLRATIAWSYDLLSAPEQQLVTQLAIFQGGWTATLAAELRGDRQGTLALLEALVDKSLVQVDYLAHATRYRFLETIREFALERLAELPEAQVLALRRRHLDIYFALAQTSPGMLSPQTHLWAQRLAPEQDNLRQALHFCRTDQLERAVEFCNKLTTFWETRSYFREQQQQFQATFALSMSPEPTPQNILFLNTYCSLCQTTADWESAHRAMNLILAMEQDEETLSLRLSVQAMLALNQGQPERASTLFEAAYKQASSREQQASALTNLACALIAQGKLTQARDALTQARSLTKVPAYQTATFAVIDLLEGRLTSARAHLEQKLTDDLEREYHRDHAYTMIHFAMLALREGDLLQAARLFGASLSCETYHGHTTEQPEFDFRQTDIAQLRGILGETDFEAAISLGRTWSITQTLEYLRPKKDRDILPTV